MIDSLLRYVVLPACVGTAIYGSLLYTCRSISKKQEKFEINYKSYLEKKLGSLKTKKQKESFIADEIVNRISNRAPPGYIGVVAHTINEVEEEHARMGEKLDHGKALANLMLLQAEYNLI